MSQFLEVVPDVLHKLGKSSAIVFCKMSEDEAANRKLPDFGLPDYFITFTIGETLKERVGENPVLPITPVSNNSDNKVEVCQNVVYDSVCVNITLDFKTEEEWSDILNFAFEVYDKVQRSED